MRNDKNECKCGRFSEEYPTYGKILQYNLNTANISQMQKTHGHSCGIRMFGLGCNAKFFYSDLTVK